MDEKVDSGNCVSQRGLGISKTQGKYIVIILFFMNLATYWLRIFFLHLSNIMYLKG
jgi:hypothetical protein